MGHWVQFSDLHTESHSFLKAQLLSVFFCQFRIDLERVNSSVKFLLLSMTPIGKFCLIFHPLYNRKKGVSKADVEYSGPINLY